MKTVTRTMCPMNCHPTLCGMLVEVEAGRLLDVRGDLENPDSRGFLCIRGQASREIIDNPARTLHPLIRKRRDSDEWCQASWDDTLDLIAARMRSAGGEAVGVWSGHGLAATTYGTRLSAQLVRRFANLWGCQSWSGSMICWGLGAFGLGLTGHLETNTKEDMSAHAQLIVLWGANLASQPNTARHVTAARRRGAHVVTIDVRQTEAAAVSDETLIVRPGSDAALALAMMHVIVANDLWDRDFVERHTTGFEALRAHLASHTPSWGAALTGVPAERIVSLATRYARTHPAMIVLGGSSMHKGDGSWTGARAIGCLPALTGNVGIHGGGFGPRHGSASHGQALTSITAEDRRADGDWIPSQMPLVTQAMLDGRLKVMLLLGTNMLSSFADAGRVDEALGRLDLVVAYDLFLSDTARRRADILLPATAWLEELGCKSTNTHLYLMPKVLDEPGEARNVTWVLRELARRLGVQDFFPWEDESGAIDAILNHPSTDHATVASLVAEGGMRALRISHVAHPDLTFATPSGKIELESAVAKELGLPALPVVFESAQPSPFPLTLCHGRTLSHFHAFYDHGRALPTLAAADPEPVLWISPTDASARRLQDGASICIVNERGAMAARAHVTDRIPPGTVWMRDGWAGLNDLTAGEAVIPDAAVETFGRLGFSGGQASFVARVEVQRA